MGRRRKVVQPGRRLARGKGVARLGGKSAGEVGETCWRADCGEVDDPMLSRKASSEFQGGPYPKTTQGVREGIPRRSGELWLRNSAKCPRNFGRRGAITGDPIYSVSWGWPQRPARSDCLLKTQVRAKP